LEVGSQAAYDDIDVQIIEDYVDWWRKKLAKRHQFRPIPHNQRLFRDGFDA
jgi:hypothetical protein